MGEDAAANHLRLSGFEILSRNYRQGAGELDIIARNNSVLAFVEVKTRTMGQWTRPAAAVTRKKQERISRTALAYLRAAGNPSVRIRFDIIEVLLKDGAVIEVHHLPNAFPLQRGAVYPV